MSRTAPVFKYLFLFFIFVFNTTFAQKAIPELWGQRVHDEAKILQPSTIDKLEKELKTFEDSTSNQIAVLIISSLEGEVMEEYSLKVAEKWRLGTKLKDNGALFVVAIDDHEMRIEVGQGLQGKLTDALCSRIIRNEVTPAFRRNAYDEGVNTAIDLIIKSTRGEYTAEAGDEDNTGWIIFAIIFGLICIGLLVYSFINEGKSSSAETTKSSSRNTNPTSSDTSTTSMFSNSSIGKSGSSFSGGGGSFDGGGSSGKW